MFHCPWRVAAKTEEVWVVTDGEQDGELHPKRLISNPSSQNWVPSPLPIEKEIPKRISSLIFWIARQNWDPPAREQERSGSPLRYFAWRSFSHKPPSRRRICQTHRSTRAVFIEREAVIPNPSRSLDRQISAYLTMWYFWRPSEACQKNPAISLSNEL